MELLRKGAHVGVGFCAILFGVLPPAACAALAGLTVVHNVWVLPRYGRALWRDEDHARGWSAGIAAYSVALVGITLGLFRRPDLAAGAWGILAFGDGLAAPVGRRLGGAKLPWNSRKTWSGLLAFTLFGGAACAAFVRIVGALAGVPDPAPPLSAQVGVSFVAALVAAGVESMPLALDDNVTSTFAGAAVLGAAAMIDGAAFEANLPALAARAIPFGVGSVALAEILRRTGAVDRGGAFAGAAFAAGIGVAAGGGLFAALTAFVAAGSAATRLGWPRKEASGLAQANQGRRGVRHAAAKLLVPGVLAALSSASPEADALRAGALAALAAALADTLGSEIGPLFAGPVIRLPSLRRAPPGTPGAVSLAGTAAGFAGAAWVTGSFALFEPIPLAAAAWIVGAAMGAVTLESIAGGVLLTRGLIGRGTLNLSMTAVAALLAMARL